MYKRQFPDIYRHLAGAIITVFICHQQSCLICKVPFVRREEITVGGDIDLYTLILRLVLPFDKDIVAQKYLLHYHIDQMESVVQYSQDVQRKVYFSKGI